jgi:putative membrane protein
MADGGARAGGQRAAGVTQDPPREELDARFTFANERTFLAWNRTALALVAAGLAAAELLKTHPAGLRLIVAIPLIVLGAVTAVTSYSRWRTHERQMRLGQPLTQSKLSLVLAVGIGVVAIAALVLAVIDVAR